MCTCLRWLPRGCGYGEYHVATAVWSLFRSHGLNQLQPTAPRGFTAWCGHHHTPERPTKLQQATHRPHHPVPQSHGYNDPLWPPTKYHIITVCTKSITLLRYVCISLLLLLQHKDRIVTNSIIIFFLTATLCNSLKA